MLKLNLILEHNTFQPIGHKPVWEIPTRAVTNQTRKYSRHINLVRQKETECEDSNGTQLMITYGLTGIQQSDTDDTDIVTGEATAADVR